MKSVIFLTLTDLLASHCTMQYSSFILVFLCSSTKQFFFFKFAIIKTTIKKANNFNKNVKKKLSSLVRSRQFFPIQNKILFTLRKHILDSKELFLRLPPASIMHLYSVHCTLYSVIQSDWSILKERLTTNFLNNQTSL